MTIGRASFFAQNFSEDFLLADAVRAGVVPFPAGDVAEPFADADDIADVAVAALTEEGHVDHIYEVTGPRLLRFADAVAEIASASGRAVRYLPVSRQQYETAMIEQGAPPEFAAQLVELLSDVLDGHNAHLSDGVQRALGRTPPRFHRLRKGSRRQRRLGGRAADRKLGARAGSGRVRWLRRCVAPSSRRPR